MATPLACGGGGGGKDGGGDSEGEDADEDGDTGDEGGDDGVEVTDPAPGGLRRLLGRQYISSINYLLGADAAAAADPPDDFSLHDFDAIGASELSLSSSDVERYELSSVAIGNAVAEGSTGRLAEFAPCVAGSNPDDTCYDEIARDFGRIAWRRHLTDDEAAAIAAIGRDGRTWDGGSFATGLRYELMAILQSPSFLYISEVGVPDPDGGTFRVLTQEELATRMSFFFLGRTPDTQLLARVDAGTLSTSDEIEAAAAELLAQPEARDASAEFFDELWRLRDIPTIGKDQELFPVFDETLAEAMRQETLLLMNDIVWELDGNSLDMFDSEYTFVNPELAAFYGVTAPNPTGWGPVSLPDEQRRGGLLTHAGWLARHAHPAETSPTRRGLFVQTKILCANIPPPPPGVDTSLPEEGTEDLTLRERLELHMEDPSCASCHVQMDPIGFALQNYDALGQFRTTEKGQPIDATGELQGLGAFDGGRELGQALKEDIRVADCMIRNMIRGGLGHLETPGENARLGTLNEDYAEASYSLQTLMIDLATSDLFRRVGEPK